jgi:hypothetical protein
MKTQNTRHPQRNNPHGIFPKHTTKPIAMNTRVQRRNWVRLISVLLSCWYPLGAVAADAGHPSATTDPTSSVKRKGSDVTFPQTVPQWISFLPGEDTMRLATHRSVRSSIEILEENKQKLALWTFLPGMHVSSSLMEDGLSYTSLGVPGSSQFEIGKPKIPVFSQWLLVPNGMNVTIRTNPGIPLVFHEIDIAPAQPPMLDSVNAPTPPFKKEMTVYGADRDYPGLLAEIEPVKRIQGQDCTLVWIYPYQYNPVQRQLRVFVDLTVDVEFQGRVRPSMGNTRSRQFEMIWKRLALNAEGVLGMQCDVDSGLLNPRNNEDLNNHFTNVLSDGNGLLGGCNLLIISPPEFARAANTLAEWKRLKGIRTKVVTTDLTGTTVHTIQDFIKATRLWTPAPQYILLLGDAEHIPCFYKMTHASDGSKPTKGGVIQGKVASDRYYADIDDGETDLFVGRLPVNTGPEAQAVVDKTISYERTPPDPVHHASFYETAALCAYFQDDDNDGYADRRFIKTSEDIFDYLTNRINKTAQRIYETNSDNPTNGPRQNAYLFENDIPGMPLPSSLHGSVFAWDGDYRDITEAFSRGCFLATYRGHGGRIKQCDDISGYYSGGWDQPEFDEDNAHLLKNSYLTPVVFSITCQAGWFDNETDRDGFEFFSYEGNGTIYRTVSTDKNDESLCEALVCNPDGGAVGVIGCTRNSYSVCNDRLTWGLMDAIWPDFIEYHQGDHGDAEAIYRMGPVLEYGRMYMRGKFWNDNYLKTQLDTIHWFGDPTLEIWTDVPQQISVYHPMQISKETPVDMSITVKMNQERLSNAQVTISHASIPGDYWTGLTDKTGTIVFPGIYLSQTGDYDIVVTAHNCLPYEGKIHSMD